jgi:hypothetical protein
MDSNHRCLGVGQKSSPLDHGINRKWTHRESHPRIQFDGARFAGPMSSCWTMSPSCFSSPSGSRGTRTHKRAAPAACFQDRFLIRPDDFRGQVAGVGIEPTPPGSEPSIATSSDNPAMDVRRRTQLSWQSSRTAGAGIEPADSWFKATNFYQQKLPRIMERDGWDSNPRAGA